MSRSFDPDTAGGCREPVSWLRLERYHAQDLPPAERALVDDHLATCPRCRECLARISADRRPLPPLPPLAQRTATPARSAAAAATTAAVQPSGVAEATPRPARPWSRLHDWLAVGWASSTSDGASSSFALPGWLLPAAGVAAALLLVLALTVPGPPGPAGPVHPGRSPHGASPTAVKGGETALVLVREREGRTLEQPRSFRAGDRFRLLLTCADDGAAFGEVVVLQGGQVFFPVSPTPRITCGNRIAIPGAWTLDGDDPVEVCLLRGSDLPSRGELERAGRAALPPGTPCLLLSPEATPR